MRWLRSGLANMKAMVAGVRAVCWLAKCRLWRPGAGEGGSSVGDEVIPSSSLIQSSHDHILRFHFDHSVLALIFSVNLLRSSHALIHHLHFDPSLFCSDFSSSCFITVSGRRRSLPSH